MGIFGGGRRECGDKKWKRQKKLGETVRMIRVGL